MIRPVNGFLSLPALTYFKIESIKQCLVHNYLLKWARYFSAYCNIGKIWIKQETATFKYLKYYNIITMLTCLKLPTASSPPLV